MSYISFGERRGNAEIFLIKSFDDTSPADFTYQISNAWCVYCQKPYLCCLGVKDMLYGRAGKRVSLSAL